MPDNPSLGLTSAEAAARLARVGPNEIETGRRFRVLREGLGLLANPLVLILIAAALISIRFGEVLDAGIIIVVILLSVALDFFQVFRSEQAANRLKSLVALTTTVIRDGRPAQIPVREIVPGDIVELRAGDLIPADATLLTDEPVSIDEAALTGESLPVEKRGQQQPAPQSNGARSQSALFAGTSIVSGVGRGLVTA
ncbi:MAG TPA: HAD-IC family P-type ATPase, partial [Chloroflexota bacterium]